MTLRKPVVHAGFVQPALLVAMAAVAGVSLQLETREFALPEDARFQESYVPAVPRIPATLAGPHALSRFNEPTVFVIGEARFHGSWCDPAAVIRYGQPYVAILELAEQERTDLIGVRGRLAVNLMLLGSTTNQVVRQASCPVLTLKQ